MSNCGNNDCQWHKYCESGLMWYDEDITECRHWLKPKLTKMKSITNLPFAIATHIIEKALQDVDDGGYVIMLLRLNFFGSQSREWFFEKYMPEWAFVHHIRIGFTDKKDKDGYTIFDKDGVPKRGSTDSIEYMHAVWHKSNLKPEYTKLVLI